MLLKTNHSDNTCLILTLSLNYTPLTSVSLQWNLIIVETFTLLGLRIPTVYHLKSHFHSKCMNLAYVVITYCFSGQATLACIKRYYVHVPNFLVTILVLLYAVNVLPCRADARN